MTLFLILCAIRLADWVISWVAIKRFGRNEKNAFTRKAMERLGLIPGMVLPDLPVLAVIWWMLDRNPESWPLFLIPALYWGWIVAKNILIVAKAARRAEGGK